jgi:hypothetical protein
MTYPETGAKAILGLGRVVVGSASAKNGEPPPIDAMSFVEPLDGWPHDKNGFSSRPIAEFGRFMIAAACRSPTAREAGLHAWICKRIYEGVVGAVRKNQAGVVYAIMPPYMMKMVRRADIRIIEIESRLKMEDPSAAAIFDRFSLYWQHAHPKLYQFPDAPAPAGRGGESSAQAAANPS